MPNGDDVTELEEEIAQLKRDLAASTARTQALYADLAQARRELEECKAGNARLIHALDCAIIWAESLFAWLPEGTVMPEGIQAAMNNLRRALAEVRK